MTAKTSACRKYLHATWSAAGLKPKTIRHRLMAFEAAGGAEATRDSIVEYLRSLPALSTRRARQSDLRCCYRTLVLGGMLRSDPTLGMPRVRVPRWVPRPLSDEEVERLDKLPSHVRDMAILALYAGLRAAEIASLEANQLERWPQGWALRIVGKGDHVGTIPAHPRVVQLLRGRVGRIFPGATANSVSHAANYWFKRVGIEGGIHRCRHSFATRALEVSGNDLLAVRDLLRHASVSTTQVYTQLPSGRLFEVVREIA